MTVFDANPTAKNYPEVLSAVRNELALSQSAFAVAAGYSAVMQGCYETAGNKSNSAGPKDKTAKAIKAMVEQERSKRRALSQTSSAAEVSAAQVDHSAPARAIGRHDAESAHRRALCGFRRQGGVLERRGAHDGVAGHGAEAAVCVTSSIAEEGRETRLRTVTLFLGLAEGRRLNDYQSSVQFNIPTKPRGVYSYCHQTPKL